MNKFLPLFFLYFFAFNVKSQEATKDTVKHFKFGGTIAVSAQQVSLTNWAAGGQNSISANGLVSLFGNYNKGKLSWDNNLDLAYGIFKQGDNKDWWKNDDRIQFASKVGYKIAKKWYAGLLLDFKTQFAPGYNYPNDSIRISDFLSPAYGISSLGIDFKPNDDFTLFISPVTGKYTIVNSELLADAGAFGVKKAEYGIDNFGNVFVSKRGLHHREEFGGYLKMNFKRKIMENVTFVTQLELFSNYLVNPENIDVNWTTLTTLKVNKYISATLSTHLIYDDDIQIVTGKTRSDGTPEIGPRTQFKQVFGLGFAYKF